MSDAGGWVPINLDPRINAAAAVWEGLPVVIGLAAGGGHNLLLTSNGSVTASGDNDCGQADVPAGLTDVVAVAAGYSHSLALRRDRTVLAWGNNARGATDVPANLADVIAIAGGGGHSVALRSDGTVVAWGQLGDGPADAPADLGDVVAIASGWETCYALRSDGTVASWGGDQQAGNIVRRQTEDGLVGIAVGGEVAPICLGVKPDGSVAEVGHSMAFGLAKIPDGLREVTQIAIGGMHAMALLKSGNVIGWGGSPVRDSVPVGLGGVSEISAGDNHTLALRVDGTVVAWGKNRYGQIEPPKGYAAEVMGWVDGVGYVLPGALSAAHDYRPEYGAQPASPPRSGSDAGVGATRALDDPPGASVSTAKPDTPSKSQVEILGSTQTRFVFRPAVKVFWNGTQVGRVDHGGRLAFEIESDGELGFRAMFRSASLPIKRGRRNRVQLSWDPTSGGLVAARVLRGG